MACSSGLLSLLSFTTQDLLPRGCAGPSYISYHSKTVPLHIKPFYRGILSGKVSSSQMTPTCVRLTTNQHIWPLVNLIHMYITIQTLFVTNMTCYYSFAIENTPTFIFFVYVYVLWLFCLYICLEAESHGAGVTHSI